MKENNLNDLPRRKFLTNATIMLGGMVLPFPTVNSFSESRASGSTAERNSSKAAERLLLDISKIPNFCTHEHWGSISSIGRAPEQGGFRCDTIAGAQPLHPPSIWDLLLDPYEHGWMSAADRNPNVAAKQAGQISYNQWWKNSPQESLDKFKLLNNVFVMTGGFQCTRRGIQYLYDHDIGKFSLQDWEKVDLQIQNNYADIFTWYQLAMKKAYFSELIRPVHPEYYVQEESKQSKMKELAFTHTIMRIDPLMDLWQDNSPRRDALAKIVGIEPGNPATWREFIRRLFDLAAENHTVGIKQLQAYRRNLSYESRTDSDVQFRGHLDSANILKFQDWVMHECCKQANERNWIHQVHVGTNNIGDSSPLPLQSLAVKYPKMKIVMIHCWPFLKEAGWLAKFIPNMYIDTCWLPILNPEFLREGFHLWLNYVPSHKIMLGHDSTHVEMATGSSLFTREILSESLIDQQKSLKMSDESLRRIAADLLQNNAVRLYEIGKEVNI
ncbi:MAG: amidohydrolase family protein [Anditalea sp.]